MNLTSLVGIGGGIALIYFGLAQGNLIPVFLNSHGLVLVLGGTVAAILINSPGEDLLKALGALRQVFFPSPLPDQKELASELVRMADGMHRNGLMALQSVSAIKGDGFLTFAARAAAESSDIKRVRQVLEDAIRQEEAQMNRLAGIFQTMGTLSPMFGLLGTLLGIVGVLKDIANPKAIGPAMAIAITTAFYGILVSALICTPIAGRIRARAQKQRRLKELIMVGMLDILAGSIPVEVEHHLEAFQDK